MLRVDGPRIETERLVLRLPRRDDFDGYAAMLADPESARHIGGVLPRAAAWRRFLQMPGAWLVQGFGMFSVERRDTGEWIGQAGPWQPEGWPGTEVGWTFMRSAWGHGYATEAARAAIAWAFANLRWDRVIHCIAPENRASQAVALRLGSANQGPGKLPDPFAEFPIEIWGQTRAQWEQRR
jgi:RimJ/RimL family protein N-acetyltransferase